MSKYTVIRNAIAEQINNGKDKFIIYPFGQNGLLTKQILNQCFDIIELAIVDNELSKYNSKIISAEKLSQFVDVNCTILITIENTEFINEIKKSIDTYAKGMETVEIFTRKDGVTEVATTKVGKYTYGPLCSNWLVESIGSFSCIGGGVVVAPNHSMGLISQHPFLYMGKDEVHSYTYDEYKDRAWYFPGVTPMGKPHKLRKIKIGSDVWIGQNVIITNSSNIGNGVIAAAGSVITKDVPDYAIVAGVPARIIRYRYTPEQIEKLNRIAWWAWSDDKIRRYYSDFFEDIDTFIAKHYEEKL